MLLQVFFTCKTIRLDNRNTVNFGQKKIVNTLMAGVRYRKYRGGEKHKKGTGLRKQEKNRIIAVTEEPPVKAKPFIDTDVLFSIHPELLNDAYIYVHCHVPRSAAEMLIRIWKTTFLVDKANACRAGLIHAENITYAPLWTLVPLHIDYSFLLIFASLPKSCKQFDLVEEIPQPGGFYVPGILRNDRDVYHVALSV